MLDLLTASLATQNPQISTGNKSRVVGSRESAGGLLRAAKEVRSVRSEKRLHRSFVAAGWVRWFGSRFVATMNWKVLEG